LLVEFNWYDLLIGIGILILFLPVLWWRKRNLSYLLFFSIFWIYLLAVVQAIFFPFAINTNDAGAIFRPSINLIPFYFGACFDMPALCVRGIIENIILTIPFGFGISFLVRIKPRNFFWLAISVGFALEFTQLIISFFFKSGFRAVDVNDVILNGLGILLGYAFFRVFAWAYLKATDYFRIERKWLFEDIYAVAFQAQVAGKSKNA